MNQVRQKIINRNQLPEDLPIKHARILENYLTGFYTWKEESGNRIPVLIGSGTFVKIKGKYFILTAHHVIAELPASGRLGVFLRPKQLEESIEINRLVYIPIAKGTADHMGPDLGLVAIPPDLASTIGAIKSYYDFDLHRDWILKTPPVLNHGVWILQGFPAELGTTLCNCSGEEDRMQFTTLAGFGWPHSYCTRDTFDYFDYPYSAPEGQRLPPERFGGCSGGGIWNVEVLQSQNGEFSLGRTVLAGVAFFQEIQKKRQGVLRCHAYRSLYDTMYSKIWFFTNFRERPHGS